MSKVEITPFGVPMGGGNTTIPNNDTALFNVARQSAVTNSQANVNATDPVKRPPDLFKANATTGADTQSQGASNLVYDYNKYSYGSPQMLQTYMQREDQNIRTLYSAVPGNSIV